MQTLATMSTLERILQLRKVPLFSDLPSADLKQVAAIASEHLYAEDEVIAVQGEAGQEIFIVVSGTISVRLHTDEMAEHEVARRGPGDYVGEMAVLSHMPRMASLIAAEAVRTLVVGQSQFEQILRERPETGLVVMRVLIDRLRQIQLGNSE
jgi:CRP-like cAMP-binding protein